MQTNIRQNLPALQFAPNLLMILRSKLSLRIDYRLRGEGPVWLTGAVVCL